MAWSKTDERTFLCLMAIAAGVFIGLVTIGFFFLSEAVSSQGGAPVSAETASRERERDNFRRAVLLLFILACAALVFIGVAGIYKMHSPQAIARRRANELPPDTKPRTPDSKTPCTDPVATQHGTSSSSPARGLDEETQA